VPGQFLLLRLIDPPGLFLFPLTPNLLLFETLRLGALDGSRRSASAASCRHAWHRSPPPGTVAWHVRHFDAGRLLRIMKNAAPPATRRTARTARPAAAPRPDPDGGGGVGAALDVNSAGGAAGAGTSSAAAGLA
jgi:hypothetical protein